MDKVAEAGESGYPQEAALHRMWEREGIGEAGVKEAKLEEERVAALLFNIPVVQGYWAIYWAILFIANSEMKAGDGPERVGE